MDQSTIANRVRNDIKELKETKRTGYSFHIILTQVSVRRVLCLCLCTRTMANDESHLRSQQCILVGSFLNKAEQSWWNGLV